MNRLMSANIHEFRSQAEAQAAELIEAIEAAEAVIVSTIERECEALRTGRMLAARALHTRLCDAATLYINGAKAARASIWTIEHILPGTQDLLEQRRAAFAAVLKVELAVLDAEREAAGEETIFLDFGNARREPALHPRAERSRSLPAHLRVAPVPEPRRGVR